MSMTQKFKGDIVRVQTTNGGDAVVVVIEHWLDESFDLSVRSLNGSDYFIPPNRLKKVTLLGTVHALTGKSLT